MNSITCTHATGLHDPYRFFIPTVYLSKEVEYLCNEPTDVRIIVPNKVVEVTFLGGDKQKAVCKEPDQFSLEMAISICITKHLLGGSSAYNKLVKKGLKVYEQQIAQENAAKAEEERIAKRRAKKAAYIKRIAEKKREEQIEIQKEAYVRAIREIEADHTDDIIGRL